MVEQAFAASEQRAKMCEMMFEKFESPAFFLSKDAVLAAFAAGRATGLVVDIGSGLTRVSPVHDGYILKKGITKNNLAGEAISQWMHRCITVTHTSLACFAVVSLAYHKELVHGSARAHSTHPTALHALARSAVLSHQWWICRGKGHR